MSERKWIGEAIPPERELCLPPGFGVLGRDTTVSQVAM
jgi:hypothetical protein